MKRALIICLCAALSAACTRAEGRSQPGCAADAAVAAAQNADAKFDREAAIAIAKEDAVKVYRSLDDYDIYACETRTVWHVFFELKNERLNGGGPEYSISKRTGMILSKKYNQ